MSKFTVGQRVRIVCPEDDDYGKEGTVINAEFCDLVWTTGVNIGPRWCYGVDVDGVGAYDWDGTEWGYEDHDLAPLTDPKADAFIESIKRLKPYEEPKVTPARVKV